MSTIALPEARGADAAVAHLQNLVRIDTRNPPGNELPAIEYIRDALAREGIASEVLEAAPGRANLVARLKGDGSAPPLLLTSHVDVVAVEEARWTHPPFGGVIADGCIWGRGTLDMKGMTAFELETFLTLRREGAKLKRDVILLALCDEEAGTSYGSKWMVEHHPDKIRAEYALNEVGGFTLNFGKARIYPIQTAEKGHLWCELTARGAPGHGSVPHADNAVVKLSQAIARLERRPLAHSVHPAARAFVEQAARVAPLPIGLALRALLHPRTAFRTLQLLRRVQPERAEFFHALLHHTVTPTMLTAGEKENVIPSEARAVLDGRFIPGTSGEAFLERIERAVGAGIEARVLSQGEPSEAPIRSELFDLLCEKVRAHDAGAYPCPWLTVGYTDGANLSKLGIRCYGFYPTKLTSDIAYAKIVHGHDERVPLEGYRWGYRLFEDVVRTFVC